MAAVKAPPPVKDQPAGLQSLSRDTLQSLRHLLRALQAQMGKGIATAALQREASSLARSITVLGAEMRQQEKFYRDAAGELDDDGIEQVVIEWLQEQPPARRARVREAMAEVDGRNTLLG